MRKITPIKVVVYKHSGKYFAKNNYGDKLRITRKEFVRFKPFNKPFKRIVKLNAKGKDHFVRNVSIIGGLTTIGTAILLPPLAPVPFMATVLSATTHNMKR